MSYNRVIRERERAQIRVGTVNVGVEQRPNRYYRDYAA